jgi:serine phosphatase RsbU (regulator of sigma subunit)
VALAGALAALGLGAGPAAAQLPRVDPLPPLDEPVAQLVEPVQQIVQEPLPSPLEEVVQDSPVAPLREEVREVVWSPGSQVPDPPGGVLPPVDPPGGGQPGNGGGDPSGSRASNGSSPSASPAGGPAPAAVVGGSEPEAGGAPGAGRTGDGTRGGAERRADRGGARRSRDGAGGAGRGADGVGSGAASDDAAANAERAAARRDGAPAGDEGEGRLARTIERIVEVVPGVVWIALAALALLALALGARSLVDRRRARALRRERERLLRDMSLLERVLLPQVPERLGDLAASVAYRPAAGPAAGGDFYDVFELPGGRVALVVGDVSGHGREALERTSSLRPTLRAHLEAGLSPRAALESAGRAAGLDPSGGFTTAMAAVHDPSSGRLTYAAAGHPPPILVGPAAHEPLTVASSPPIGVGLRTGLRQTTVALPRGSAACFFTDGVLEARTGDELLGRDWLAGVVAEFGPLDSATALLDRVVERADEVPDDMTACLIRAVAGPEAAGPRVEELELDPGDVGAAAPERLLRACGVPDEAASAALAEARRLAVEAGRALLSVTIEDGDASVRVTAPTREALTTT